MEDEILGTLKSYTEAFYQKDFDAVLTYLYQPDVDQLYHSMLRMMDLMIPFGEQAGFLQLFPEADNPDYIRVLGPKHFFKQYFSAMIGVVQMKRLREVVASLEIEHCVILGDKANVNYSFINFMSGQERMEREDLLVKVKDRWKLRLRSGLEETVQKYQREIDNYQARKAKDKVQPDILDDELELFELYGYRDFNTEATIIEPRFRAAGEFSEGLAPVKVFSKYGYIDKMGEFAIIPEFDKADVFSEGMAKVGLRDDELDMHYGFIDITGTWIVQPVYDQAEPFSDGMAAVCLDDKWGFIDENGEVKVEINYLAASNFQNGQAYLTRATPDDEETLLIDTDGNILDRWMSWEEE
ncbi:MAG: hypothetical protein DHS20C18_19620 [Saprospiraceae bacterium]|nr:MAG: hypothetical protein DHS20C18_19620 [Saprospiraceae bacterium]